MDPQAEESRAAVLLAFVNQAAPDIRRKLQQIERLGKQTIQDLLKAAEKVFNNRETPEEREESKSGHPSGVPFVFGDTRMPSPSTWTGLVD